MMAARRRPAILAALIGAMAVGAVGPVAAVGAPASRGPAVAPAVAGAAVQPWDGSVDLYRDGVFTTQQTFLWCTAAGVQIVRNIVDGEADHARASQARYFDWMRARNRYDLPESAGVDPTGWTAGLRHFVDDRYRLVASRSFEGAVLSAVTNLRRTGLPVALAVANGGHGWILTGFSASADPLVTDEFEVRSVRVVGPLWGLQSRNGYDMRPNTSLTIRELRRFFTPWRYDPLPMVWDGRYVSIQPVVREVEVAAPTPGALGSREGAGDGRVVPRPVPWSAWRGPLWLSAGTIRREEGHR